MPRACRSPRAGYLATLPVARWDSVDHGLPVGPAASRRVLDPRITARVHDACPDVHGVVYLSLRAAPRVSAVGAVAQPTPVLRGGDPLNLARGGAGELLAHQLRHAQLVTVPGAGHDPRLDQPATCFAAVLAFRRPSGPDAQRRGPRRRGRADRRRTGGRHPAVGHRRPRTLEEASPRAPRPATVGR